MMELNPVGRTITEVLKLANGQVALILDDESSIICSFARQTTLNPVKARFGRVRAVTKTTVSQAVAEADAIRQADEVAHLGGRKAGRKTIVHGEDFGSSEFMPEYLGVDRSLDEQGRHNLRVTQSTSDIPEIR